MMPWEQETDSTSQALLLEGHFTTEELALLHGLRQRFLTSPAYVALGIDESRLTFARWLVEHGKLSEGIETP